MMLSHLRRSIFTFARYSKPVFRNIINPHELLLDTKSLMNHLKASNAKLANLELGTPINLLNNLGLPQNVFESVAAKQHKVSCFDSENRQYAATLGYSKDIHLDVEPVEIPVSGAINLKRHFSIDRGVINVKEIILKKNQLRLVNLPSDTTANDLRQYFEPITTNIDIQMKYCVLGLPAYAIVTINNPQQIQRIVSHVQTQEIEDDNERTMMVKDSSTNERQKIANRRISINGLAQNLNPLELLTELSKYGRIIHFDFPQIIHRNASKHEIYAKHKNSDKLIKIKSVYKNGHFQQEYYPNPKPQTLPNTIQDFNKVMYEKTQSVENKYLNRLQYAEQITIYPDSEEQIITQNRGYCLVLFSCSEEAQNAYFHLQQGYDVELVQKHQFYYDHRLKQELFRFIDNEAIRKQAAAFKNQTDPYVVSNAHTQELQKDILTKLDDINQYKHYILQTDPQRVDLVEYPEQFDSIQGQQDETDELLRDPTQQNFLENQAQNQDGQAQQVGDQANEIEDDQETLRMKAMFPNSFANQQIINNEISQKLEQQEQEQQEDLQQNQDVSDVDEADPSIVDRLQIQDVNRFRQAKVQRAKHGINYNQNSTKVGRTFSELAQLEIFGKIINRKPVKHNKTKHVPKQSPVKFDYDPLSQKKARQVTDLLKYDLDEILEAQQTIQRENEENFNDLFEKQQKRIATYMKRNNGELPPEYKGKLDKNYEGVEQYIEEGEQAQGQQNGNNPPRAQFSTVRERGPYRPLNKQERNIQLADYNKMIRQLVNEYFGNFDSSKFGNTQKTYNLPTLNRQEIKFTDQQSFLTQQDLPKALNFHWDQQAAETEFHNYYQLEESFKSMPIGFRDDHLKDRKKALEKTDIALNDIGVVEQAFEAPEHAEEIVEELNMFQARHGQSYQIVEKQLQQQQLQGQEPESATSRFIVKTIKKQPLFPIDQITKLSNLKLNVDEQDDDIKQILEMDDENFQQGGSIFQILQDSEMKPEQISDLLQEVATEVQIPVKVLMTFINLKKQHLPLIQNDIRNQLDVQKKRMQGEKLTPDTINKGLSNNDYLRKRNKNKFVTSKFKQL